MDVGLFDLYTTGHHLSYAARIKEALEAVSTDDITFITLSETERCVERFASDEIAYVDDPESPPIEDREESFGEVVETKIGEFCSGELIEQYDLIHFLYADDILGPLWRHSARADETHLVGELNGVFFHRGTILRRKHLHPAFLWVLQSPAGRLVDTAVPAKTSHEMLWQDLHLYRFLREGTFDDVVVHSREAKQYLARLAPEQSATITEIPYPAPVEFGADIQQRDARERLDLPREDRILLFFGGMRTERGIDILLEALRQYRGPPFTMLLAGPPTAVSEQEIERIDRDTRITIRYEFGFIDTPELYYRVADAVVLPYTRQYGKERASQMFEEVCGADRPVIVPDYGVLGRLTREWELGATYEQGSVRSLVSTMARFARGEVSHSSAKMREYSTQHSYDKVAVELSDIYSNAEFPIRAGRRQ